MCKSVFLFVAMVVDVVKLSFEIYIPPVLCQTVSSLDVIGGEDYPTYS